MRHRVKGKHLSRTTDQRRTLRRQLATALFTHERIQTTLAKAEFVRDDVEKMITIAKRGLAHDDGARTIHARRLVLARLGNDRAAMEKLFGTIAPRFADRAGGYTRIYKLGPRKGDNAEMVILELVDRPAAE
jgi:large subunit ribosomal protein L17